MKRRYRRSLGALLLLTSLGACQTLPKPAVQTATVAPLPEGFTPPESLSAYAELEMIRGGKTQFFDVAILAQSPNRLSLSLMDELGRQKAFLVADGAQVFWRNEDTGEEQRLDQDAEELKRTLNLPLSVEEFVAKLLLQDRDSHSKDYQVAYDWGQGEGRKNFPQAMLWQLRRPKVALRLSFRRSDLNPKLDAEKFEVRER